MTQRVCQQVPVALNPTGPCDTKQAASVLLWNVSFGLPAEKGYCAHMFPTPALLGSFETSHPIPSHPRTAAGYRSSVYILSDITSTVKLNGGFQQQASM